MGDWCSRLRWLTVSFGVCSLLWGAPLDAKAAETEGIMSALERAEVLTQIEEVEEKGPSPLELELARRSGSLGLSESAAIQSSGDELEIFGAGVFTSPLSTFAPITDVPVPLDYILGPGDMMVIFLYGRADTEHRLTIDRDGEIALPSLGPLNVGGLRFKEAQEVIINRIETGSIGERAAVTLGDLRSVRVFVLGDVISPGSYTVSGLSTLTNAIIASGGIAPGGSLRHIELRRSNKLISEVDLYDLLLRGDTSRDVNLEQGDVIFVPPIGPTAAVEGAVHRPAIYELSGPTTATALIDLAGGLRPGASLRRAHIERFTKRGERQLVDSGLAGEGTRATPIETGDVLRVFPATRAMRDIVVLSGHVQRPGSYPWKPGMTVSDLIPSHLDLLPDASVDYVLIRRESGSERTIEILETDLRPNLRIGEARSSTAAMRLEPRDEVLVFSNQHSRSELVAPLVASLRRQGGLAMPALITEIRGNVRYPGEYPTTQGMTVGDLVRAAGGGLEETDTRYALIVRETHPERLIRAMSLRLDGEGLARQIRPRDRLIIFHHLNPRAPLLDDIIDRLREQTEQGELSPVVAIRGFVRAPGFYPLEPSMTMDDLVRASGGMIEDAFSLRAELTRSHVTETGITVEHRDISLARSTTDTPGERLLAAYDQLSILRRPDEPESLTVRLTGEVRHPGTYSIRVGERLSSVLYRAGGLTPDAYAYGARLHRRSVQTREQSAIDQIYSESDDTLLNLFLSPTMGYDDRWFDAPPSSQVFGAVRDVAPPRAAGRVVVDLGGILAGQAGRDIALEHGDHLHVPQDSMTVSVVGQVYRPTSHRWRPKLGAIDYIKRSGGFTELANEGHTFVVQANGEVRSLRTGWYFLRKPRNPKLKPGDVVFAPVHVRSFQDFEAFTSLIGAVGSTAAQVLP